MDTYSAPTSFKEGDRCRCGKVCFSKRTAQTKSNFLHNRGNARHLRIYPCPESNTWHLTNSDRANEQKWKRNGYSL